MLKALSQTLLSVALSVAVILGLIHSVGPVKTDFSTLRQATWQLTGDMGSCSGVMIKENLFLTAAHCEQPNMKIDGQEAITIKKDEDRDLLLLFVYKKCPCVPVAKVPPSLDSKVFVIGYPLAMGQYITEGRYQGLYKRNIAFMTHTAPTVFGNSGGPVVAVIDGQFQVVGIVSAVAAYADVFGVPIVVYHMSIAASTYSINAFLK